MNKVAQAIEDELVEAEVTNNLNNIRLSTTETEHNANNQPNDNEPAHQNGDILVSFSYVLPSSFSLSLLFNYVLIKSFDDNAEHKFKFGATSSHWNISYVDSI